MLANTGRDSDSRQSPHVFRSLVTCEMSLSIVLLVGAVLLMESVLKMSGEPLGFRADGLVVTGIVLPADRYSDPERRLSFYDRLASRLGDRAVIATGLPPYGPGNSAGLRVAGATQVADSDAYSVGERTVGSGYFELLGISLLRGRTFDARDRATTEPVAVIGESIAREYFHGAAPIGQRIRVGSASPLNPWRTIVGVVLVGREDCQQLPPDRLGDTTRSVRAAVARTHRGPFPLRFAGPGHAIAARDRRCWWRRSHWRCGNNAGAPRSLPGLSALSSHAPRSLRGVCPLACRDWSVRSASAIRGTAHARDRRAHGGGGDARRCAASGRHTGRASRGAWSGGRRMWCPRVEPFSHESPSTRFAPRIRGSCWACARCCLAVAVLATWLPARRAIGVDPAEALRAD